MSKKGTKLPENIFNEEVLKMVFEEVNITINKNILDKISEIDKNKTNKNETDKH